jgi:glycogen operon protein
MPSESVNYVTSHDGFTLRDLVSYERKHNLPNGEDNRDGADANYSRNWGVEGATHDPRILARRERVMRNLMATLAFSEGVPMLSHGDEMGRTQYGNNNAYAQDNETTWVDWSLEARQRAMLDFTRRVFSIRHKNPVLRRRSFLRGQSLDASGAKDLSWIHPDGREMTDADWHDAGAHVLGMLINGDASDDIDDHGRPIKGDSLLLIVNNQEEMRRFTLPTMPMLGTWVEMLHTAGRQGATTGEHDTTLPPFSLVLLRYAPAGGGER